MKLNHVASLALAINTICMGTAFGQDALEDDRTLAAFPDRPFAAMLCWHCGRMDDFVPEAHDVALDAILTEAGMVWPESI